MGACNPWGGQTLNYRHSYHAGNFADVMKHVVLVALIDALRRKPAPFSVLDTHAGIGLYDLSGREAQSTGEWHGASAACWTHHPILPLSLIHI